VVEPRIFFQPLNQSAGPSFVSEEFTRRGLMGCLRRGIAGFRGQIAKIPGCTGITGDLAFLA
jgi:hypothetical protein